ncbi:MAG: FAD-binding oxidoreductase [Rhodospirillaceae bacterium]|nr:FAD-binding oxidoreductase [Rhodospirillaceae bacterium]
MNEAPPSSARAAARDLAFARIRAAVGEKGWTDDPAMLAPRLKDERGLYRGRAAMLVRPGSTAETAAVVAICHEAGIPIVPQGGNTSMVGGSVPDADFAGIILATGRMNRIRAVDPVNNTITVEAGCILADIQKAAAEHDRLFPLSLGAEGTCQIGGNLSTNAGGTAVLRYGNTRELMMGLEVVLPDGRVWDGLRGLRKDNTGYALRHLFVGAEGTLGIVTAAVLKLFPLPTDTATAIAAIATPHEAVALLGRLNAALGDAVTGYEIFSRRSLDMVLAHIAGTADPFGAAVHPQYLLIELSGQGAPGTLKGAFETALAAAAEDGLVRDAVFAASTAQARAFWKLRESITEAQKSEGGSIKHDVAVPVSRVADFIDRASAACEAALSGVRVVAFGHVGDGNIHFNLSQPLQGWTRERYLGEWERMQRIVHDIVMEMGGSFSAEHGIGRLKRGEMRHYRSAVELDLMRKVKAALDPDGIMNPGRVI